jgi:hypothetical protein
MRHPTDGTLRRLLDEPAGVADADREHVAGCPQCRSGLAAAQQDAALTAAALDADPVVDVEAGWSRLSHAVAVTSPQRQPAATAPRRSGNAARWRAALRSPVIAVVAVVALVTGASAAAAADWLQIFRTERIAPITVSQADLLRLPDLSAYGRTELLEADIHPVADAAAAEKATGLAVPRVDDLPRGVTGQPTFQVGNRVRADFTFSTEKAARAASAAGHTLPPVPPGLDGSRFRMNAGPGLAAVWSEARGFPALVVARVVAPTAESSGIPFATARDYLLSLSGLPEDVAAQLRGFTGDGKTLPVHVLAEELTSSTADVGGTPATVLTMKDGTLAVVLWVTDGVITAVAGSLSADELLSVARGLVRQ